MTDAPPNVISARVALRARFEPREQSVKYLPMTVSDRCVARLSTIPPNLYRIVFYYVVVTVVEVNGEHVEVVAAIDHRDKETKCRFYVAYSSQERKKYREQGLREIPVPEAYEGKLFVFGTMDELREQTRLAQLSGATV